MPFELPDPSDRLLTVPTGGDPYRPPAEREPALPAAFRMENPIVSVLAGAHGYIPDEEGHNPLDLIRGTDYERNHLGAFAGSRSSAETRLIMAQIDREEADRKTLDAAGMSGVLLQMLAGTLDPTILFPAGSVARAVRGGIAIGRTAARGAAAVGAQVAGQEALLQASQETRTGAESAIAIGSATLLGALIGGGAAAALSRGERQAMVAALDAERTAAGAHIDNVVDLPTTISEYLRRRADDMDAAGSPDLAADLRARAARAEPERIQSAAIRVGETIYTGPIHADAFRAAAEAEGFANLPATLDEGFVTTTGRYVTREQAFEIARQGGQMQGGAARAAGILGRDVTAGEIQMAPAARAESAGEPAAPAPSDTGSGLAASVGAAAADTRALEPVGFLLDRIPGWSRFAHLIGTDLGVYSTQSVAGKRTFSEIAETTLRFRQNVERTYKDPTTGETRTLAPEVTSPVVPLDREVRLHMDQTQIKTQDEIKRLYSDYFYGQPDATLPYVRAEFATRTGRAEGKLSPTEFDREIAAAMQQGDRHAIPQVEQAAQFIRREVIDPWATRMEAANPDFKRIEFGPGESYFPYRWEREMIEARPQQFVDEVVLPHLEQDQAVKAAAKERLEWLNAQLKSWQQQIAKLEARFGRTEDRAARIEAKATERARDDRPQTAGMNEAEPEGRIADLQRRSADIEAEIRDMQEAIELMEELLPGQSAIPGILDRTAAQMEARGVKLRVETARHAEAGRIGKLSERRLAALERQLAEAEHKQILIEEYLATAQRAHDDIRAKIEEEIAAWEGKSVIEAKSAMKAREKYAAETGRGADEPRLQSADTAIDRVVRRIIDSDRDLSRDELRAKAEEIKNHVLGTPIGRIPYDIAARANEGPRSRADTARGPLLARDFNIPYAKAKDWLSHDLDHVLGAWMRTMVPDTLLWERFPGEGPALTSKYRQIQEEYDALVRGKGEKQAKRLNAEKDRLIATISGVLDRVRGVTNNTTGASGRAGEAVRRLNQMTDLGFAAWTSVADFGGPVLAHGLANVFRDGWAPLFKYLGGDAELAKMSKRELRDTGIAVELENATRGHALAETSDAYAPRTTTERMLKAASDRFFLVNMQAQETNAAKRIAGRVVMASMLRAIEADAAGKATKKQVAALREGNISEALSRRIWDQFNGPDGGAVIDGTPLPNTANWTDERARTHFLAAVARDVERAVVTPGQEKPLWLSTNVGSLLGQYKSFTMAATNKLLISNIQRHDAQTLQGVLSMVAMGMIGYRITTLFRGQKPHERPQDWVKEGINRSGLLGALEEVNMFAGKATRGTIDFYRLIGADKPLSRNANRTILSSLLGPTAGKIENITRVTGAIGAGEWTAADTHAVRRSVVLQNVFWLHQALDAVEAGANGAFGIPARAQ